MHWIPWILFDVRVVDWRHIKEEWTLCNAQLLNRETAHLRSVNIAKWTSPNSHLSNISVFYTKSSSVTNSFLDWYRLGYAYRFCIYIWEKFWIVCPTQNALIVIRSKINHWSLIWAKSNSVSLHFYDWIRILILLGIYLQSYKKFWIV